MDEFGLYPREEPFDPLGVMLFKALQVVSFLFFMALLAVSPDTRDGKVDSKAEFIITMDWPDNDFIVVNGRKIPSPIREEVVTVRGIVPGEYTVNVVHFQATTGQPVAATVKVQKLNPTAQVIFDDKLTLDHTGDEKTALRFRLDAEGKVIDVQQRQKSLLEKYHNERAN